MSKQKFEKAIISKGAIRSVMNNIKANNIPYKISVSNYTYKIESDLHNIVFMKKEQSFKMFAAYQKIKKDLKGLEVPLIDKSRLVYFEHDIKESFFADTVYSIDLKSAYSTSMMLRNLLSADTFNYIKQLPKQDRLACIGMLASHKDVFLFDNENNEIGYEEIVSPFEGFFYQCVTDIYNIIQHCKKLAENDYVFSWVDCVYIRNPDKIDLINNYLSSEGYNSSIETLKKFSATITKETVKVNFWKEKETVCEYKPFELPNKENYIAKELIASLIKNI